MNQARNSNNLAATLALTLTVLAAYGGNCSRARVESLTVMNEGVVLAQQKRHLEAIKSLEKAVALDATNDQALWNLAIVHMELQQLDRARDDLQRATAIKPDMGSYHEKLGTVLQQLKDWEGARKAFEKAIELDPTLFKGYFKLGQVLEQQDDAQNALKRYTEAAEKGPRFIESYAALGALYADLGYNPQAAQVLQEGLKAAEPKSDDEGKLHHLLGTVFQQERKYPEAVREFQSALAIIPGMPDALFSLGWTYALQKNWPESKAYLTKFVKTGGAGSPPHYLKAARDKLAEIQ